MDRRTFLTTASLIPAALRTLDAQSPGTESGFTSLFDGQTLGGWSVREGPPSAFRVANNAIVVDEGSNFPTWLRSDRQYENFDFRCEFFLQGWMNSGIYLHAPEHGRNTWVGMKINIFHQTDREPKPESTGSIFPLVAPRAVNVKNKAEWSKAHTTPRGRSTRSSAPSIQESNPSSGSSSSSWRMLVAHGSHCLVRINGETVLEHEGLQNVEAGRIELQAHDPGRWIEYKQIRIKRL